MAVVQVGKIKVQAYCIRTVVLNYSFGICSTWHYYWYSVWSAWVLIIIVTMNQGVVLVTHQHLLITKFFPICMQCHIWPKLPEQDVQVITSAAFVYSIALYTVITTFSCLPLALSSVCVCVCVCPTLYIGPPCLVADTRNVDGHVCIGLLWCLSSTFSLLSLSLSLSL